VAGNGAGELGYRLNQRRALQRPLSRLAPPLDGRFREARLSEVMRQQFRLGRSSAADIIEQNLGDATVQNSTPALEQIVISRVLNKRMLEAIFRFWR